MTQHSLDHSFLYGANSVFIEELYQRYLSNPASVDASWSRFFASLGDAPAHAVSWNQAPSGVIGQPDPDAPAKAAEPKGKAAPASDKPAAALPDTATIQQEALMALQAQQLIRAVLAEQDRLKFGQCRQSRLREIDLRKLRSGLHIG